jgi:hypothetical protein
MRFLQKHITVILVTAFAMETFCATYALHFISLVKWAAVIHTVSGVSIACCLLFLRSAPEQTTKIPAVVTRYQWLLLAAFSCTIFYFFKQLLADNPIDFHDADMLPVIRIMNERFLSGNWSHVYDVIPEIWNGIRPIYLPAMWLPFSIPVFLQADPRWVTAVCFLIAAVIFIHTLDPRKRHAWMVYGAAFVLYGWLLTTEKTGLIIFSEEGVVLVYYVLLVSALTRKNYWLTGITASLCVLSRYALIGWLPAMLLYLVALKQWKNLFRFSAAGLLCLLVLLVLPFGWTVFFSLSALPAEYISFTERVWQQSPQFFTEGLGWARFFVPAHMGLQHRLLIVLSFLLPLIAMAGCLFLIRKGKMPAANAPLAVLKLTVVVFFTLIDVPYLYLFYTSSFISLIAVSIFLMREKTGIPLQD